MRLFVFIVNSAYLIRRQQMHLSSDVLIEMSVSPSLSQLLAIFLLLHYVWRFRGGLYIAEILGTIQYPALSDGRGIKSTEQCL